ncbi:TonB-dependent receptor plug domain-containing protein [Aureisphaera galaxeae]|uniref:TonB-dependent receptor plug domain-containing protein n=1 Tax=Aureisphaera galaxeae TaxID=1538023 RepID=UPI002350E85F|nr:TonB-dependent receptor plug domain-containing protein [Aureisphaera galaxeae]MDC8004026.1 TonB-dependent receptor plug domain-containing protein [Aureisphaera galaxeae]
MIKKLLFSLLLCLTASLYAQEKVTIAWDVSLSMQDRSTDKEIGFLDKYFAKYPQVTTRVILFNGVSASSNDFTISEGNWDEAKAVLKNAKYDGPTGYHTLKKAFADGTTFLFTDGMENIEKDTPPLGKMLYVVNSKFEHNLKGLQFLALSNKGRLINMAPAEKPAQSEAVTKMYTGNIYGEDVVPETVSISIKNSETRTVPNSDGTFQLEAKPGDIMVVEVPGISTVEEVITENTKLNVWIRHEGIQLSQVFLKNEKAEEEEEQVNIGYSKVDKKSLGYAVQNVSSEEMNTGLGTMSSALSGKISGVGDGYATEISVAKIRQANSVLWAQHPLIMIDGAPLPKSITRPSSGTRAELTNFIDVNNIADITVLKGFAATNQYGSEGAGGVILITTKGRAAMEAAEKRRKEGKSTQKKTNQYQGTVKAPPKYTQTYLTALQQQPDTESAYALYGKQRTSETGNTNYYIDAFDFFATRNQNLAKAIGLNILEMHTDDFAAMRALLFKAKEKKFYEMELDIAKAMLSEHPNRTQAYLDLAKAQKNNGNNQAALDLLLAITKGTANPNLDFTPLNKTAHQEIRNLVASHKDKLELSKIEVSHLKKEPLDARIVFDWSDWGADFELTFVNPKRDFVTWKHTAENQNRLMDEQIKGYMQEEFEISGGDKGVWLVNVKYLGNRTPGSDKPVFLRCNVQYGFGTANERTEEYVLRLFEKGSEQLAVRVATQ